MPAPTADDLMMIQYQETVFQRIADRFRLPLSEVGVIAATFLDGLDGRELADVRKIARAGYQTWVVEDMGYEWAS
ncbi:MAG TPA: hypothetical protein VM597_32145 [Gemmataceae bacterium]|jgi:hypothetical protein|nr:hypothetical protein [Gemmataceae bacterium]